MEGERLPYWLWLAAGLLRMQRDGKLSATQVKRIYRGEFHDIGIHPFDDTRTVAVKLTNG